MSYDLNWISPFLSDDLPEMNYQNPFFFSPLQIFHLNAPLWKENFLYFQAQTSYHNVRFACPSTYLQEEFLKPAVEVQCT